MPQHGGCKKKKKKMGNDFNFDVNFDVLRSKFILKKQQIKMFAALPPIFVTSLNLNFDLRRRKNTDFKHSEGD